MTIFEVSDLLRRTILLLTPVSEAIFYWSNAPRPSGHFASITVNTVAQVGFGEFADSNATDGDLDRKFETLFDIQFGVEFYRAITVLNATQSAALLSGGLIRQEIIELWNSEGVGLVSRSPIRDITRLMNSSNEDRSQLDITMQALISAPDEKVFGVDSVRVIGEVFNTSEKIEDVFIGPPL